MTLLIAYLGKRRKRLEARRQRLEQHRERLEEQSEPVIGYRLRACAEPYLKMELLATSGPNNFRDAGGSRYASLPCGAEFL